MPGRQIGSNYATEGRLFLLERYGRKGAGQGTIGSKNSVAPPVHAGKKSVFLLVAFLLYRLMNE
jgi:hypothetical protein